MNDNLVKALYREYYNAQDVLLEIINYLPLPFLRFGVEKVSSDVKPESLISSIRDKAKELKMNHSRFNILLKTHVNALLIGKKPTKSLEKFLRSYLKQVKSEICAIPNTLDKAVNLLQALIDTEAFTEIDQIYDAIVLLSDKVSSELISKIVRNWKEEAKFYKEEHKGDLLAGDIFWVSRDFMETIDGVSRYRFREHFDIGEFDDAFHAVESMLATHLLEGSSGIESHTIPFWGDQYLTSVAFDLWLVSRSQNLSNRLRAFVDVALRRISAWQFPEGWWTDFQLTEPPDEESKSRYLPSAYTTALCTLNLLKLAISEPMRKKGILGTKWLIEKQNPDGSWTREIMSKDGVISKPDIFLSLLSLEALVRSGIKNIKHSIDLGLEWIILQQNEFGMWEEKGISYPFITTLVLEFINLKDYLPKKLNPYLSMSKDFLFRSLQFSLEENSNSNRLAIITAFQGIETFLYSVLSHPSVNIKIFESADETIGLRKALTKFQIYLQDKKEIKPNEVIPYRNSLDNLAYLRDQVVHKGADVSQSKCRSLIKDALKFASKYSLKIYGFDCLA